MLSIDNCFNSEEVNLHEVITETVRSGGAVMLLNIIFDSIEATDDEVRYSGQVETSCNNQIALQEMRQLVSSIELPSLIV